MSSMQTQAKFNITTAEYESFLQNPRQKITRTIVDNSKINDFSNEDKSLHIYKNLSEFSKHIYAHNTFDILLVCNGYAIIDICGNEIVAAQNSFVFLSPGVPYSIENDKDSMVLTISVSKTAIATVFHQISAYDGLLPGFFANGVWGETSSTHIFFKRITNPNIYNIVNSLLYEELNPEKYSDTLKKDLFLSLVGYINAMEKQSFDISAMRISKSEQIIKILAYIQNNYRNVTLETLALHFHYTVPYVSKLIRSSTGFTFTDILREIKFDVCLSLLLNSDLKINRIAEVAGFQNTDHFNRIFKKRMGETPSEYRKNKIGIGIDK